MNAYLLRSYFSCFWCWALAREVEMWLISAAKIELRIYNCKVSCTCLFRSEISFRMCYLDYLSCRVYSSLSKVQYFSLFVTISYLQFTIHNWCICCIPSGFIKQHVSSMIAQSSMSQALLQTIFFFLTSMIAD